jgi:SanA protein
MTAASQLYKEKRVDCLLVSGDNAAVNYNEIKSMQLALMEKGVPPERIFGDYAGFRTLDSVVRAKEVF